MTPPEAATQAELRLRFLYEPESGLVWKRLKYGGLSKRPVGSADRHGHLRVSFNGRSYMLHRVIWCYVTGSFPRKHIDHKDHIPGNNRWINLREATVTENLRNTRLRSDNTSGHKGVSWRKDREMWSVRACTGDGRYKALGCYKDKSEAVGVYQAFARSLHGEFYCSPEA